MASFLYLFSAILLSTGLVELIRRWANNNHIIDVPNHRSSHAIPTPRGGGLAIVAIVLIGWLIYGLLIRQPAARVLPFLIGGSMIAAVGWIDDMKDLKARLRFSVQIAAAAIAMYGFDYCHAVSTPFNGFVLNLGLLGPLFTIIWIVGLTNAYNFMDGIDGMAGGQAVFVGLSWFLLMRLGLIPNIWLLRIFGLLVVGSSMGFLMHNWSPARIFMGDVGSVFLGYTLAMMPLMFSQPAQADVIVVQVFLVWPFIFDTGLTFIRRLLKGENVLSAHRSHLYQRLVIAGASHQFVTLLYVALSSVGLLAAILWLSNTTFERLTALAILLAAACGLLVFVQYQIYRQKSEEPIEPVPSQLSGAGK